MRVCNLQGALKLTDHYEQTQSWNVPGDRVSCPGLSPLKLFLWEKLDSEPTVFPLAGLSRSSEQGQILGSTSTPPVLVMSKISEKSRPKTNSGHPLGSRGSLGLPLDHTAARCDGNEGWYLVRRGRDDSCSYQPKVFSTDRLYVRWKCVFTGTHPSSSSSTMAPPQF